MTARALLAVAAALLAVTTVQADDSSTPTALTRTEHDYLLSCAGCHRFDGSGSERIPSLDRSGEIVGLAGGREYLGSVPGVAQAPLDDERLAAVLNWVVAEFGGAVDVSPYTAEEMARLRSQPLRAPREARRRIADLRP